MKILTIITLFLFSNSLIIKNDSVDNVKIGMNISEFLESKRKIYKVVEEIINIEGNDYPIFNVCENSELIYAIEPDETKKSMENMGIWK